MTAALLRTTVVWKQVFGSGGVGSFVVYVCVFCLNGHITLAHQHHHHIAPPLPPPPPSHGDSLGCRTCTYTHHRLTGPRIMNSFLSPALCLCTQSRLDSNSSASTPPFISSVCVLFVYLSQAQVGVYARVCLCVTVTGGGGQLSFCRTHAHT